MTMIKTNTKKSSIQWVWNIPNDWEMVKIKYLFWESKEKVLAEEYDILSLTLNWIKIRDISNNDGQLPASFDNYKLIKKWYIVFNPMDLKRWYVDSSPYEWIISPAYIVLVCKDKVDTNFYRYYFQWHYNNEIFWHMWRWVSEDHRWTLEEKILFNYKVALPEINLQEKIATFLDKKTSQITTFIKNKKRLIELLEEQKISIINKAVTKWLDENVKMKDSWIPWIWEIPEDWEKWKISRIFKNIWSWTTPESWNKDYYENWTIKWVNTWDLNDSYLYDCEKSVTELALNKFSALKMFEENSLIIAMYWATIWKLWILQFKATTNQACCVLSNSNISDIKYIYYWFLSNKEHIIRMWYWWWQPNISQDLIKSIKVPLPKLNIQINIVEYLDVEIEKINNAIQKIEKEISLIEEYRDSLIYQAVTWKLNIQ